MKNDVINILDKAGFRIKFPESDRSLKYECTNHDNVDIVFVKPKDISCLMQNDMMDAVVACDVTMSNYPLDVHYHPINGDFGNHIKLVVVVKDKTIIEEKIKTNQKINLCSEYIYLTNKWLTDKKIRAKVTEVPGSGEGYLIAGMFDGCVVISETGLTIKENNLEIFDTIYNDKFGIFVNKSKVGDFEKLLINQV
jgi:ATP phosphoribosyltransferase